MKYLIAIVLTVMVSAAELSAQVRPDSTAARRERLRDADGDGISDAGRQRKNDRFIDRNGDGICDGRERGLGFRRSKEPNRQQNGKQQQRGRQ